MGQISISLTVNGKKVSAETEARRLLGDFLRDDLGIRGTHFGCEQGVCGACTVLVDGVSMRSCLMFAAQADGADIQTAEALADGDTLHPLQAAFKENHALQCGYCTPGMLMTAVDVLRNHKTSDRDEIREEISGNVCRCTGYSNIVSAIQHVAEDGENI